MSYPDQTTWKKITPDEPPAGITLRIWDKYKRELLARHKETLELLRSKGSRVFPVVQTSKKDRGADRPFELLVGFAAEVSEPTPRLELYFVGTPYRDSDVAIRVDRPLNFE